MPIIRDLRGNEFFGSVDQVGQGTITDARTGLTGSLINAVNAVLEMDLSGQAAATFDIRTGAFNGTLVFEVTVDGVNWLGVPGLALSTEAMLAAVVITTTHAQIYTVGVTSMRRVRVRCSAYTSGTVTVTARASMADYAIIARPYPSNLHVTATAAANTITTATLPTPGAGLFHYITHISCMRNATAALAGTATLIITSTNLPGSPAWSIGNAMAAGGTQVDVNYTPTTPLKSSVANTATTIVMPAAGAAVLNRINVSYYVGA
jgi:hypothetical protein